MKLIDLDKFYKGVLIPETMKDKVYETFGVEAIPVKWIEKYSHKHIVNVMESIHIREMINDWRKENDG